MKEFYILFCDAPGKIPYDEIRMLNRLCLSEEEVRVVFREKNKKGMIRYTEVMLKERME